MNTSDRREWWWHPLLGATLAAALACAACDGGSSRVIVQLRTDLVPGVEFHEVRTRFALGEVTRDAVATAAVGDDFVEGRRVAELVDVPPGTADVEVELVDASGAVVASRPLRATYDGGAHAFTVLVSRRCRGVTCPASGGDATATACVDGTCRDPACTEENPEACGDPECASPGDCPAGAACAEASCVAGRCLLGESSGACGATEWCDPTDGCRALPAEDGGAPEIDAGNDAGPPAPPTIDPAENACAEADATGFVEVGRVNTGGQAYGMWSRPPYLLVASTTAGLSSYTFDGTSFTRIDEVTDTGWTEAIWNDGALFYVSAPGTGLSTFELGSDGRFVRRGAIYTEAMEARRAWGDGTHVFVPNGAAGFVAYGRSGTSLSLAGSTTAVDFAQGAFVEGPRIYLADGSALRAYSFDGADFTEIDNVPVDRASRLWGLDGTLHVGTEHGLSAYQLALDALEHRADAATTSQVREVWSDGVHVFAAAEIAGVYAYRYDGAYTQVDRIDTPGNALGVVGDGTYIYVGDGAAGVAAYTGFSCRRLR